MSVSQHMKGRMNWNTLAAIFVIALLALSSPASAANASKEIGKAFLDICLLNLPDLARIEASARAFKWRPADSNMARMLGPENVSAPWRGWLVNIPPAPPYFIGIYQAGFRGGQMATCLITTTAADVSADTLVTFVTRILDLWQPIADDTSPGRRLRLWEATIDAQPVFITLTDAQDAGERRLTLTGMMKATPAAPAFVLRVLTKIMKYLNIPPMCSTGSVSH